MATNTPVNLDNLIRAKGADGLSRLELGRFVAEPLFGFAPLEARSLPGSFKALIRHVFFINLSSHCESSATKEAFAAPRM